MHLAINKIFKSIFWEFFSRSLNYSAFQVELQHRVPSWSTQIEVFMIQNCWTLLCVCTESNKICKHNKHIQKINWQSWGNQSIQCFCATLVRQRTQLDARKSKTQTKTAGNILKLNFVVNWIRDADDRRNNPCDCRRIINEVWERKLINPVKLLIPSRSSCLFAREKQRKSSANTQSNC